MVVFCDQLIDEFVIATLLNFLLVIDHWRLLAGLKDVRDAGSAVGWPHWAHRYSTSETNWLLEGVSEGGLPGRGMKVNLTSTHCLGQLQVLLQAGTYLRILSLFLLAFEDDSWLVLVWGWWRLDSIHIVVHLLVIFWLANVSKFNSLVIITSFVLFRGEKWVGSNLSAYNSVVTWVRSQARRCFEFDSIQRDDLRRLHLLFLLCGVITATLLCQRFVLIVRLVLLIVSLFIVIIFPLCVLVSQLSLPVSGFLNLAVVLAIIGGTWGAYRRLEPTHALLIDLILLLVANGGPLSLTSLRKHASRVVGRWLLAFTLSIAIITLLFVIFLLLVFCLHVVVGPTRPIVGLQAPDLAKPCSHFDLPFFLFLFFLHLLRVRLIMLCRLFISCHLMIICCSLLNIFCTLLLHFFLHLLLLVACSGWICLELIDSSFCLSDEVGPGELV